MIPSVSLARSLVGSLHGFAWHLSSDSSIVCSMASFDAFLPTFPPIVPRLRLSSTIFIGLVLRWRSSVPRLESFHSMRSYRSLRDFCSFTRSLALARLFLPRSLLSRLAQPTPDRLKILPLLCRASTRQKSVSILTLRQAFVQLCPKMRRVLKLNTGTHYGGP